MKNKKKVVKPESVEKNAVTEVATPVEVVETKARKTVGFKLPTIAVKKDILIKIGVGIAIALVLIPVVDWVVQTSISSKYVAFYKEFDVSRKEYEEALESKYGMTIMQNLLAQAAVNQLAKEKGVTVSADDVNKAIADDKAQAGITTDEQFASALEQAGITEKTYRQSVELSLKLDKLSSEGITEPTEAEMQDYFAKNSTLYTGKKFEEVKETIKASMISGIKSAKQEELISNALANYSEENILIAGSNDTYKFLRSLDLVKRLFAK